MWHESPIGDEKFLHSTTNSAEARARSNEVPISRPIIPLSLFCRQRTPCVDSPLSISLPLFLQVAQLVNLSLEYIGIPEPVDKPMFSDCFVCGKTAKQIQDEAAIDYMQSTVIPGETAQHRYARRLAFLAGMKFGTLSLVPGSVAGCRMRRQSLLNCPFKQSTEGATCYHSTWKVSEQSEKESGQKPLKSGQQRDDSPKS